MRADSQRKAIAGKARTPSYALLTVAVCGETLGLNCKTEPDRWGEVEEPSKTQ